MSNSPNRSRLKRKTTKRVDYREPIADISDLFDANNDINHEYIEDTPKKKRKSENNARTNTNSPKSSTPASSGSNTSNRKFKYQKFLNDESLQWNLIPLLPPSYRKTSKFSNVLDLDEAFVDIKAQIVYNTEAVLIEKDESIFMVSEPPGEPYYIGRVVEFVAKPEFAEEIAKANDKVTKYPVRFFNAKMNWYYRFRDIQEGENTVNCRKVYASLHQDICPINSYRGKCTVVHKAELQDVLPNIREEIVRSNVFYFDSLFDRYTRQFYTVYPTSKLLNNFKSIPSFLYALEKKHRYVYTEEKYPLLQILEKYVFKESYVESERTDSNKQIQSDNDKSDKTWDKRCQECHEWCLPDSSLECDDCGGAMHLYCMDPPLSKKPGKKIAWVCSFCVRKQSNLPEDRKELHTELERVNIFNQSCRENINKKAADSISKSFGQDIGRRWFQYIGCYMISHMADILDDTVYLPYPFKISRYGEKYQWSKCYDRDAQILSPYDKDNQDERGTENSSSLLWITDKEKISDSDLTTYVEKCKIEIAPLLDMNPTSCNFLDFAVKALIACDYDAEKAFIDCMNNMSRPILNEPTFTADEVKKFEEGVSKHGGELRPVWKHVGTQSMSMIVRFYYNWKKTDRGMKVRGKKKPEKAKNTSTTGSHGITVLRSTTNLGADAVPVLNKPEENNDVEMRYMDDSSFDTDRLALMETAFHCLFCNVDYSPMWYKVTGGSDDENNKKRLQTGVNEKTEQSDKAIVKKHTEEKLGALCIRCARLWRRYGIRWVHPLDVIRKMHGACVSSYHNALEKILDETNINKLTLSPDRARIKCLEWELVQDAELIIRQRWEIMKDHKKFKHMKKQSMNFHGILTRTVRRPYSKQLFTPEKLHSDLSSFIAERCDPSFGKQSQESNSFNPLSEEVLQKQIEATNGKDKTSSNNEKTIGNNSHKIVNKSVSQQSGKSDIMVNFDTETFKELQVTVDKKFKSVRLNDNIVKMLLNDSADIPEKILQQLKGDSSEMNVSTSSIALPLNTVEIPHYFSEFTTERDTMSQIKGYHTMASNTDLSGSSTTSKTSPQSKVAKCAVCFKSVFYPSNGLMCHKCGLICHKSCYGKSQLKPQRGHNWLCDICSSNINEIISTDYQCSLCYNPADLRKENSSGKLTISSALKPTSNGHWCHVVCSLFNNIVRYGNTDTFEPAINITDAIWKVRNHKCMICNRVGGGLVKCDKCPDYFHVTCAQSDKQAKLLFKREVLPNDAMDGNFTIINDQNDNSKYTLSPVIICNNHEAQNSGKVSYHSLTSTIDKQFMIDIIAKCSKSSVSKNAIFTKYKERNYDTDRSHALNIPDGFRFNESNIYVIKKQQTCRSCGASDNAFWYGPDLCHCCHVANVSGDKEAFDKVNQHTIGTSNSSIPETIKTELLEDIDPDTARLS